jgi:hypothetical protein
MKRTNATKVHRKSGGAQWRDLQCRGLLVEMLFFAHTGGGPSTTGTPWMEDEIRIRGRCICLAVLKSESGLGSIRFKNAHGVDHSIGVHPERNLLHSILHSLGNPGQLQSVRRTGEGQPFQLLLQLRMAEQKSQRRTQIVHLRGGHTLYLGISGGIKPGVLAVQ